MAEKCENTDYQYDDDRLQQIRDMVGSTNNALIKLDKDLKFIKENEDVLKQHEAKSACANYIPLHHSRHKEFVESVTMLVDFINNWDHHAATHEACSYPRLKASLQQVEAAIMKNERNFNGLEEHISELQSFYESVKNMSTKSDNTSSL